jgi:hypothetical protein
MLPQLWGWVPKLQFWTIFREIAIRGELTNTDELLAKT